MNIEVGNMKQWYILRLVTSCQGSLKSESRRHEQFVQAVIKLLILFCFCYSRVFVGVFTPTRHEWTLLRTRPSRSTRFSRMHTRARAPARNSWLPWLSSPWYSGSLTYEQDNQLYGPSGSCCVDQAPCWLWRRFSANASCRLRCSGGARGWAIRILRDRSSCPGPFAMVQTRRDTTSMALSEDSSTFFLEVPTMLPLMYLHRGSVQGSMALSTLVLVVALDRRSGLQENR